MTRKPGSSLCPYAMYRLGRKRGYARGANDCWDEGVGDFAWEDVDRVLSAAEALQDPDLAGVAYRLAGILPPP